MVHVSLQRRPLSKLTSLLLCGEIWRINLHVKILNHGQALG